MLLSLLVILLPILVIMVALTRNPDQPDVPTVDWRPTAARAAEEAPYPVLAPTELPAGWRATRVTWTPEGQAEPTGEVSVRNRWRLGVLTDQETYIELVQGDKRVDEMVESVTREGIEDGSSSLDGRSWTRMISPDDRTRSLVSTTRQVTTVVSGDTSYQQLESYAGLLSRVG